MAKYLAEVSVTVEASSSTEAEEKIMSALDGMEPDIQDGPDEILEEEEEEVEEEEEQQEKNT